MELPPISSLIFGPSCLSSWSETVDPLCLPHLPPARFLGAVLRARRKLCLPSNEAVTSSWESVCGFLYHRAMGEPACLECEGTRILPCSGEGCWGQGLQPVIMTKWALSGGHTPQGERRSWVPEVRSTTSFVVVIGKHLFTLLACTRSWLQHMGSLVAACELLVVAEFPDQELNPDPLHWEAGVLATGPTQEEAVSHLLYPFIWPWMFRLLPCLGFHVLATVNSAAVNIGGPHVSFWILFFYDFGKKKKN